MTLDELLASLFPQGHDVRSSDGLVLGSATLSGGRRADIVGVSGRTPLGVDGAIRLSRHVLDALARGGDGPIVVLVDSDSQRMSKRDELLGLSEFLAHLSKSLLLADFAGRHTIGVLYGHSAAGAFIATALSTRSLVAVPGADPAVMDLPSMSRVTKLPIETLEQMAKSTPVFAPGIDNIARMGAIAAIWDGDAPLAPRLEALLAESPAREDRRDRLGAERAGRPKAAGIAERVRTLALAGQ